MKPVIITPCFNIVKNAQNLIGSIKNQDHKDFKHIIIDDCSTDGTSELLNNLRENDDRFEIITNKEKKFALLNILDASKDARSENDIIFIVDGDDELIGADVFSSVMNEYSNDKELDALYTKHKWDINGMNISEELPDKVSPYEYKWVSSHLKTFRGSILDRINEENFKFEDGEYFTRGYDFALYAPILHVARKRKFLDKVCYLYKINSVSIPLTQRNWHEREQLRNIKFIRARGFVK